MNVQQITHAKNVQLSKTDDAVVIIDQTQLPNRFVTLSLSTRQALFDAIRLLQVRGAPAIGIAAAYGAYVLARQIRADDPAAFDARFFEDCAYLRRSRPTAVNLGWALDRMQQVCRAHPQASVSERLQLLRAEAVAIHEEDMAMCRAISEYGFSLLTKDCGVLTHCNAGPLATSRYGTAQGPMFLAKEKGLPIRVFADETRPLLQGARLTAYEMYEAGVDVTLICDNMAATVMKNGWVDLCFVGCDRIAANGDTANKIGTSGVAILAKYYGIPFYTLGPSSTIDLACPTGADIPIELRDPDEIKSKFYLEPMAPAGVKCYNPSFDVTDHSLIAGIITEKGIVRPPFDVNLKKLFG